MKPSNCQALRQGDQMHCGLCGLQWDVDDPDPPECLPVNKQRGLQCFAEIKAQLSQEKDDEE